MAGNINHPYKSAFGKYDFFADTAADWDNTIGMDDNRADNALVYISPSFSGLKLMGAAVAGENAVQGWDTLASAYSLAAAYEGGGLMAAIAYEDIITATNFRVGAGYKMDAFAIAGTYETVDPSSIFGSDVDRWTVQASFGMGNNKVKAMYGNEDIAGGASSDAWAVGVDHSFSKRTSAYALYVDSERGLRSPSSVTVADGTCSVADGNPDKCPNYGGGGGSGFSVGMVHKF
jgi:predicted porin